MTMRIPIRGVLERFPNSPCYRLDDAPDAEGIQRYRIRVQPMVASTPTSSPAEQFREHLKFLKEKGSEYRIISDRDLEIAGCPSKLAYVGLPAGDGITAITGWLIIQTGDNTFIVFAILSSGVDFPSIAPLLESSFNTINLKKLEQIADERLDRLRRGQLFLETLTPDRLKLLADNKPRWFRIYRPGAGPNGSDKELGWFSMRTIEGERGSIAMWSVKALKTPVHPEMGLIVEINAKMLIDGAADHTVDIESRFWEAWDRSAESWSSVSTERQGKLSTTWGQTGIRSAELSTHDVGSILTVTNSTRELETRKSAEYEVPNQGYICQPEVLLMGRLLPRDGSIEGDLAFYWYDTRANKMPQRLDRWKKDPDGSGRWTLQSRASLDSPELTQLFSPAGERLRRIDADGLVTEAIELQDLQRIWKAKGLPTG